MPTFLFLLLTLFSLHARRRYLRAPRRLTRGLFKQPSNRARIGHTAPGVAYAVGNSFRGLWFQAVVLRKKRSDRDVRKTRDGVLVVNHWVVSSEGWRSNGHGDVRQGVEGNVWADVQQWTARGGFRIHTVYADIVDRRSRRMGRVWEPKRPHDLTVADWRQIDAWCDHYGVAHSMYALRANAAQVPLAHQAGVSGHVLSK